MSKRKAKLKALKVRNETARAAWERGGAGVHSTGKKDGPRSSKKGSISEQLG